MEELKLIAGQVYHLKVTEFRAKNKAITKQDGQRYELFYVKVMDDGGKSVLCEFACLEGQCKSDTFVVGVKQYVRCGFLSQRGTPEIEPSEEPTRHQPANSNPGIDVPNNAHALKIQGSAFTFSMGYAKDILIAEVAQRQFGSVITDEDIDKMIGWAEKINEALTSRISF